MGKWGHRGVFGVRTDPGGRAVSPAARGAPQACLVSKAEGSDTSRLAMDAPNAGVARKSPRSDPSLPGSLPPGLSFPRETKHPRAEGPSPTGVPRGRSRVAASTKDLVTVASAALPGPDSPCPHRPSLSPRPHGPCSRCDKDWFFVSLLSGSLVEKVSIILDHRRSFLEANGM